MKKFYLFIVAFLALAINASAFEIHNNPALVKKTTEAPAFVKMTKSPAKAPAKAALSIDDVVGDYIMSGYEYAVGENEQPYLASISVSIVAGENPGEVYLIGNNPSHVTSLAPIVATVDLDKATLTVAEQSLGQVPISSTQTANVELQHYRWVMTNGEYSGIEESEEPFVALITADGIEFDYDDMMFFAALDVTTGEFLGAFSQLDAVVLTKDVPYEDPYAPYVALEGKATFVDGYVLPMVGVLGAEAKEYAVELTVEQSTVNPNIYRLINPYKTGVFTDINESSIDGAIVINCSDPNCVLVEPYFASGFTSNEAGIDQMYCLNLESLYYYTEGEYHMSIEEIKEVFPKAGYNVSNLQGTTVTIYNCCFGLSSNKTGGWSWQDQQGNPLEMTSIIELPASFNGIGDIVVDNSDAPVEYFNLQGVRVVEPAPGLYIRRQGTTATKVVIR